MEGEIRVFARDHLGLIDRPTAIQLGATGHSIEHGVSTGRWKPVHAGVYDLNVTPRTWLSDVMAAVLAGGNEAVASHRTAARLWGLDGIGGRVIEITVPFTKDPVPHGVIVHRTRRQLPCVVENGIRVTTVERTLLDLATLVGDLTLEKSVESALRKHLTTFDNLLETIDRDGGRGVRGTRRFRRVLGHVDGYVSGSPAEVEAKNLIRLAAIPQPVLQPRIPLPNGENAYPDFAWPDLWKIVEIDGYDAHSTPDQLEHDLNRQNMLMALGWEVRRFSAREVQRDPQRVSNEIVGFVVGRPL